MTEEVKEPHVEDKPELNREDVIKWYDEQIELAAKRSELAKLQAEAVQYEAQRIQAAMMIGQMRAAQQESENQNDNNEQD